MLVFALNSLVTRGVIGTLQGLIDAFLPFIVAVAVGGVVFLVTAQLWKLIRRLWAARYASTPRSAFVFGVCLAIVSLVLIEWLLANLRLSSAARTVLQVVLVLLTSIAAVEAEAFFLRLTDSGTRKERHPLIALLFASSEYAKKQAALTSLSTTILPSLYHRIGKRVAKLEKVPQDLAESVAKTRGFEDARAGKDTSLEAEPSDTKPNGFAGKMLGNVRNAAKQSQLLVQLNTAYVTLGRQAVEKYGEKAAPQELREELAAALQKSITLRAELDALSKAAGHSFWTPRRVAIGAACVALVALFVAARSFSGASSKGYGASSTQSASTQTRDEDSARSVSSSARTQDVDPGVAFMQVLMGMAAAQQAQQSFSQGPSYYSPSPPAYGGYAAPQMRTNMSNSASQPAYRRQEWQGTCTRCGWNTGRQVVQGSNRCIQIQGGGALCGGVIVWAPAQGF